MAPDLIRLNGNGFPDPGDAPVPARLEPATRDAVTACPALALRLADADRHGRTGGR